MAPKKSELEELRKQLAVHFTAQNKKLTKQHLGKSTYEKYETMALVGSTSSKKIKDALSKLEVKKMQKKEDNSLAIKKKLKHIFDTNEDGSIIEITNTDGVKKYFALSDKTRKKIYDYVGSGTYEEMLEFDPSDSSGVIHSVVTHENFTPQSIKVIPKSEYRDEMVQRKTRKSGKFFKYYCRVDFDFSRYGILKGFDAEYYQHNCFYHALEAANVNEIKLTQLRYFMKDAHLSICKIPEVCKALDISIELHQSVPPPKYTKVIHYGNAENEKIRIGLIDDHYFIMEDVDVTKYAIENYDDVKHLKNWNRVTSIKDNHVVRRKGRCMDSFDLVKVLLQSSEKLLTPIKLDGDIMSTPYYNKTIQSVSSLEYNNIIDALPEPNKCKDDETYYIVYFDFETVTTGDIHEPYMVKYCYEDNNQVGGIKGYGQDLGYYFLHRMIEYVPTGSELLLIAHNMRYDLSFISKFLYSIKTCKAGGKIISVKGYFGDKEHRRAVHVRDSLALIPMPLRDFSKCFNLENVKKEIINYEFYNHNVPKMNFKQINHEDNLFSIQEATSTYYKEDAQQFLQNIHEWGYVVDDKYNALKYASKYCEQDVLTLKKGYQTFRKWIKELYEIDTHNTFSISGLAHKVMVKEGCYDGCWRFGGVVRHFISQAVVGGRTMISNNEKKFRGNMNDINFNVENENEELLNKLKGDKISDFDGVSLYPSSMYRVPGYIKGVPKPFYDEMTYEKLQECDYYFVEILIKNIGIDRNFSLVSEKNEEGVRIFNNNMKGKTIIVDKITLEDLIEFQKVEFDVIRGYTFNDGFNTTIQDVIYKMFTARLQKKKEKNPIQLVYKLLMNAGYGRTIMKEQETEDVYFNNNKDAFKFIELNYNNVVECRQLMNDRKYVVRVRREVRSHMNYCHIGAMILSMSKRIMNEVICTAEDNGIEIFYQDTDSMHLYEKNIPKLREVYNQKYGRELIGNDLGQFHTDFEMDTKDVGDVSSLLCVMLGKKCYVDVLKGDKSDALECHIRLKGVSTKSIKYTAKKLYNHKTETMNILHLYKDLYDGKKIQFDLTCGGTAPTFETFDLLVRTRTEFMREIQF